VPDAYRLPGTNAGYLAVQWLWSEDMGAQVEAALGRLLDEGPLDGVVIDLRSNRGGWRSVLEQTLASFTQGATGDFFRTDRKYPLAITPNAVYPRLASTPLVVLVDGGTQSYAEVFAAALQASGRAQVVGTKTPGNTETIFGHDFDDGSRLWLAQEGFQLPSGENLEGRGVVPDAVVDVDWTTFSDADDPQIVKALELLKQPSKE
jgi:carboxyl-terminal processing protease